MLRAATAAIVVTLLLAGCGEEDTTGAGGSHGRHEERQAGLSKGQYEQGYREITRDADARIAAIPKAAAGGDVGAVAAEIRDFAAYMHDVAERLDKLEPPRDIAREHQGYVRSLRETAQGYEEIAGKVAASGSVEEAAGVTFKALQKLYARFEIFSPIGLFLDAIDRGDYDIELEFRPPR